MIFDRCKNCKHYKPDERKFKAIFSNEKFKEIFSNEVNTKYLRQGTCDKRILSIPNPPGGMYRIVNYDGWCEKYERKTNEDNNKHHVYNYTCPNCHTILSEVEDCNYCPTCGTKLDWSKNEGGE